MDSMHSVNCNIYFLIILPSITTVMKYTKKLYSENNTWEPAESVATCKNMLEEFERNLAKQKELKASQQQANTKVVGRPSMTVQKPVIKVEPSKPGPSTAAQAVCVTLSLYIFNRLV